jgi:hypothetical protein
VRQERTLFTARAEALGYAANARNRGDAVLQAYWEQRAHEIEEVVLDVREFPAHIVKELHGFWPSRSPWTTSSPRWSRKAGGR